MNRNCTRSLCATAAVLMVVANVPFHIAMRAAPDEPPATIDLIGSVRDFQERSRAGGHTDFETRPDAGYGHYSGNIAPTLGADGKPAFIGGGRKVQSQYRDAEGRPISHHLYDGSRGDVAGAWGATDNGGIASLSSFPSWFNDQPGVNMSKSLTLTFQRGSDGNYVFDDTLDPLYSSKGGFFPLDDELYGDSGGSGPNHNFHFTFELHTRFTYDAAAGQIFQFIGDDDVWVFIDGKLVIDLGGVHGAVEQFVDISRLGLSDGESYALDFFFAERHRTESNFRIVTNLLLEPAAPPTVSPAFD